MQKTNGLLFVLLVLSVFIFSCSKNNDSNPPQVQPKDTLGGGWQKVKFDSTILLSDIFFVNNQTGFVCGENYLGKSADGGKTWNKINLPDSLEMNFINLFFIDENTGWAAGYNGLLRTIDGGSSWKRMNRQYIFDIQFFDANNGYATVFQTGLFQTTDGGITLNKAGDLLPGNGEEGLFFLNAQLGWVTTTNGIYNTSTAGNQFVQQTVQSSGFYYALQFKDQNHGWAAGYGGITRTVDGGQHWQALPLDANTGADIHFFDNNNGFVMSATGVYSTADGGTTLVKSCAVHTSSLIEIHFTDESHGWAVGSAGYILTYVKP